jgi:hypothetical protein
VSKYKPGDYIVVTGKCSDNLIGKTVQVVEIYDDCYLIRLTDEVSDKLTAITGKAITKPWRIDIADANSKLNKARTVLYGN